MKRSAAQTDRAAGIPDAAKRSHRTRDLCLILCLLLSAGVLFLLFGAGSRTGNAVEVRLHGETVGIYPLDRDTAVPIDAGGGEGNLLVIENGRAYVRDATCPDRICVRHRPVSRTGECIVCLPHSLSMTVIGDGGADFVQ